MPAEQRPLTSDALAKKARIEVIGASLQTPTTIRRLPNKLCGKAKAEPIDRRRGPAAKSVGKPDAANPHVRFDERGRETEPLAQRLNATAPLLDSTISRCENVGLEEW
jgi:hypothetical protein